MIITRNTALNLVSNSAVVQKIPELNPYVEQYKQSSKGKVGCKSCSSNSLSTTLGKTVLDFLGTLNSSQVAVLKTILGDSHLYVYVANGDGKTLKELM